MRRTLLTLAAAGAVALTLPSCTEAGAEVDSPTSRPSEADAELDDIERAATEAADQINADNADAELEKLKAELNEKK